MRVRADGRRSDMAPAAANPPAWTTPAEIEQQLRRLWERGRLLAAGIDGEPLFPLELPLRKPDARALLDRFDEVRQWIRGLEEASRSGRGFGYSIVWEEINHRQLGRNRLPAQVQLAAEEDALRLIGKTAAAERFRRLAAMTRARLPELADWLWRKPMTVVEHAADWESIVAVLEWFRGHPRCGLYLRQLDIAGVDTKFIETRKGLIAELLDRVLPPESIAAEFTGARNFEARYGLRTKPPLIRFRLLDERLSIGGFSDLTVPAAEFARIGLAARRVFITENEINGLSFPMMPESLVIFGLGYSLEPLFDAGWLQGRELIYWGDIDTHGFAILSRLRARFPHVRSLLMDRETLLEHRPLWVREETPSEATLAGLTGVERALLEDLRYNRLGDQVRLEQERIPFGWVQRKLAEEGSGDWGSP